MSDWKTVHANESGKALAHPLVVEVMREFADNIGFELTGLSEYGLAKVAMYAAQVARAQAQGFDPDLLRLTAEEANSALWEKAAEMVFAGVPTVVIEATVPEQPVEPERPIYSRTGYGPRIRIVSGSAPAPLQEGGGQ